MVTCLRRSFGIAACAAVFLALVPRHAEAGLLIASRMTHQVLRFDDELNFIDVFIPPNSGGLNQPVGMAVGSDGDLYIGSQGNEGDIEILRFDGLTGQFDTKFVDGIASGAPAGLGFGPDTNLYTGNFAGASVDRLTDNGGALVGPFTSFGEVFAPTFFKFHDGSLFVSSYATNQVLQYNGTTGNFMGVFAESPELNGPAGLHFADDGTLYVVSLNTSAILHYAADGDFIGQFADVAGLFPADLLFAPDNTFIVTLLGGFVGDPGGARRYSVTGELLDEVIMQDLEQAGGVVNAPFVLGDMDGDNDLDNFDIQPFELAITDRDAYLAQFPTLTDYKQRGDIDGDDDLDNFDIQPFESLLTSGPESAPVPEPGTALLLGFALMSLGAIAWRRRV